MKLQKYIPYLLVVVVFLVLFFRPVEQQIVGNDSYYFLNYVYGYNEDITQAPVLSQFIFNIIPANIFVIRLIMLLVALLSVHIFMKCAELYNKDTGWVAGLIITCTAFFMKFLFEFEDDLFAKPILFLGLYFIIKYQLGKQTKHLYLSLVCVGVAGLLWKMSIFYFILFLLMSNFHKIYCILSVGLVYFARTLFGFVVAGLSFVVSEYVRGFYLVSIALIFFLAMPKQFMISKNKISIIVFSILSFLNSKITVVLLPLLSFNISKHWLNYKKPLQILLLVYLSVSFIVLTISFLYTHPNNYQNELFNVAHSLKQTQFPELEVKPYWGFGHYYIWWSKQFYPDYGSYKPTPKNGIVVTYLNDSSVSCPVYFKNKVGKILICA